MRLQVRCVITGRTRAATCRKLLAAWLLVVTVTGRIPKGKQPETVDRKLVEKYGIDLTERQRAQRKKNAAWLTCSTYATENWFVLLATEGNHPFKATREETNP